MVRDCAVHIQRSRCSLHAPSWPTLLTHEAIRHCALLALRKRMRRDLSQWIHFLLLISATTASAIASCSARWLPRTLHGTQSHVQTGLHSQLMDALQSHRKPGKWDHHKRHKAHLRPTIRTNECHRDFSRSVRPFRHRYKNPILTVQCSC